MKIRIALIVLTILTTLVAIFILACPKPSSDNDGVSINRPVSNDSMDPTESDNDADEGESAESHDNDGDEGG